MPAGITHVSGLLGAGGVSATLCDEQGLTAAAVAFVPCALPFALRASLLVNKISCAGSKCTSGLQGEAEQAGEARRGGCWPDPRQGSHTGTWLLGQHHLGILLYFLSYVLAFALGQQVVL